MLFEECRTRAIECLRLAHEAAEASARAEWVNAAQQWLQRADKVRRTEWPKSKAERAARQCIDGATRYQGGIL